MKQVLPHIEIGLHESGQVQIAIEDYELSDFIEDYLVEKCGVQVDSVSFTEIAGAEITTMYVDESVGMQMLEEVLSELSPKEIQRIYNLNKN